MRGQLANGQPLRLSERSSAAWLERALSDVDTILLDHAHCEKKAASTAMNLIFRYQHEPRLMRPLSELAREELEHFERVLSVMERRGVPFEPLEPSPYAAQLYKRVRKQEPHRLLDTLLVCSIIEARSCERMRLLAESLEDDELARLYRSLLASEARHHESFVQLAVSFSDVDTVQVRLRELMDHEAEVLARPVDGVRLHT